MEQYLYEDLMSADVPWPILYADGFFVGLMICIVLALVSFALFITTFEISWISFAGSLIFGGIILGFVHSYSSRFGRIIDSLGYDFIGMEAEKWNTFCFDTIEYGKFTLRYDVNGKYRRARYRLWIMTEKDLPDEGDRWVEKGQRDIFYRKDGEREVAPCSEYLTPADVLYIKSLREIRFERGFVANRVIATLDDLWFYSETTDILRTLKLMRRIEGKLDGKSRLRRRRFCDKSRNS